jgi:protocatechuate 3,4-dioxygenase beta subunit
MKNSTENRREFLKKLSLSPAVLPLLGNCRNSAQAQKTTDEILNAIRKHALDPAQCNWCGASGVPGGVNWKTFLAEKTDDGEPLVISGTVFQKDGVTPAPNVLIYAYHTNAKGFYGRSSDEPQHGKHRGWMLTDARGRYEFQTIKPGFYPSRDNPAHIHFTLTGVDFKEDWIDSIWFENDSLITPEIKKNSCRAEAVLIRSSGSKKAPPEFCPVGAIFVYWVNLILNERASRLLISARTRSISAA